VVAKFFEDIASGHGIVIDGDGEQTRDFIYVGDLCRAILLALDSSVGGEVFQIATGVETSIRTPVKVTKSVTNADVQIDHGRRASATSAGITRSLRKHKCSCVGSRASR